MTGGTPGAERLTGPLTRDALAPHAGGLGDMFAYLWRVVIPHTNALHTAPWRGRTAREYGALANLARRHGGARVPPRFIDYLAGEPLPFASDVPIEAGGERAFTVMLVIDCLANDIHPGSVAISASARAPAPCRAASHMRQRRWIDGHYGGGIDGTGLVVPKGPLYRRVQDEKAMASGDRLDTQFGSLSLLEARTDHYSVSLSAVSPKDFAAGYDPADVPTPVIGFGPIAEDHDDLSFQSSLRQGRPFLDAKPTDPDALAARTVSVVRSMDSVDIILLPELCTSSVAVTAVALDLSSGATHAGGEAPRLIALGSGLSQGACPDTGRPYNECAIVDGKGRIIWTQRKLHHFRMSDRRMTQCAIATVGSVPHAEDVATDAVLQVRDLPHFGRVMVLICEDLEQRAPGGDVAYALRPDWILTPVLDIGQAVGRWTHQRAIEIARLSDTRIVVSNSATLAVRQAGRSRLVDMAPEDVGIGLCLEMGGQRRLRVVTATDCATPPVRAQVPWTPDDWSEWSII